MRLHWALFGIGILGLVSNPAAGQEPVLDLNGTYQTSIPARQGPPTVITLGIKQQGTTVSIIHVDGFLTPARGAEIFRGTLEGMTITNRRQNPKGEWVVTTVPVDNPDEIVWEQAKFLRISSPPAGNPACEASNRFHVQGKYAVSRGAQLRTAKKFDESVCWYKIAADEGYPAGLQGLAYAYWKGNGVRQDYAKALELDRAAADKGDAIAQSDLAYAYTNGLGVPKDPQKAAYWNAKVDAQIREMKANKVAAAAQQQRDMLPFRVITGAMGAVLGPHLPQPDTAEPPVAARAPATQETRAEGPAEVTITVRGTAEGSDDLHIFWLTRLIPVGTLFTLVYTFDDSKGQAYGTGNCPDWGSGITGSRNDSPGTAVLTIGGKSFTFGKGPNVKSSVWRKVATRCTRSEIAMEVSQGVFPNFTGVNTRAHAPTGTNSLTQDQNWRDAAKLDNVDANDPNNVFGISFANRTGIETRGVLRVKSIEVSGPQPLRSASNAAREPAAAPSTAAAGAIRD